MTEASIARSRAPTVFLERIKNIRSKNTVIDKSNDCAEVLYKIADCIRCAGFIIRTIGDPRGRFLVRAISIPCNNRNAILRSSYVNTKLLSVRLTPLELLLERSIDGVAQDCARNQMQVAAQLFEQPFEQRRQ